jgi:hypothetical protein
VNKSYKVYEFAGAKVMSLNKGAVYSTHGPLADSEDDIEKDMQQTRDKKKSDAEDKREAKKQVKFEKKRKEEEKAKALHTIRIATPFDNLVKVSKSASGKATLLRISTVTYKTTLIIQLSRTDTFKTLFSWVDKYRDDKTDREYELHTIFPIVEYRRTDTRTLEDVGLYPERALTMQYINADE